jgi:hypothetical protein
MPDTQGGFVVATRCGLGFDQLQMRVRRKTQRSQGEWHSATRFHKNGLELHEDGPE